jgi:hypothetical protein
MIQGFVGSFGSGKTLHLTKLGISLLKRGRTVVSNSPVKFTWRKHTFSTITVYDSQQFTRALVNGKHIDVLLDESGIFLPNNYWNKFPAEIGYKLSQVRHFDVNLFYTVQGFGHSVKRLRDLTNWVVVCQRRKFPIPLYRTITYKDWSEKLQKWQWLKKPNFQMPTYFHGTLFAPDFFKHNVLKQENIKKFIRKETNIYPSEARHLYKAYDSWQDVTTTAVGKINLEKQFNIEDFKKELSLKESVAEAFKNDATMPVEESSEEEMYDSSF